MRSQVRKCIGPDKTNYCRGASARHHVCENMPCEKGGLTHSDQCEEFDTEGRHWVASYNSSRGEEDKCTLICQNTGHMGTPVTMRMAVVRDGTDCMPRNRHTMCVQGLCQVGEYNMCVQGQYQVGE